MNRFRNIHKLLFLMVIIVSFERQLFAKKFIIPKTKKEKLIEKAEKFQTQFKKKKEKALQKATEKGWIIRKDLPDSSTIELQFLNFLGKPQYYITDNGDAAETISTDKLYPGGALGLSLTGSSMTVGEWDGGAVRASHALLSPRVTQVDGASSLSGHATHVAGTLIANDDYGATYRGMAYQASLDAYDWSNDQSEMATAAANDLLISNHSYSWASGWKWEDDIPNRFTGGTGMWRWYGDTPVSTTEEWKFGFYSSTTSNWDGIAYDAPYYLIVKSAGNDRDDDGPDFSNADPNDDYHIYYNYDIGDWDTTNTARNSDGIYDCIPSKGTAKNILTVGSVYDISGGYSQPADVIIAGYSGYGPTDDGRIKPDVVSNGQGLSSSYHTSDVAAATMSGTSMASPSAAGSLILLQQHYINVFGDTLLASTLKGLAIHTADEAGNNNGPDYEFGWGLLNISSAADHITNAVSLENFINEDALAQGELDTLIIYSEGTDPLWATLCWTDVPGTAPGYAIDPTDKMLVNDLDLRILDGSTNYPWLLDGANPTNAATQEDNDVDNVEQVCIESPSAGYDTVLVTHKGSITNGPQVYSLLVSGALDVIADLSFDPDGGTYTLHQEISITSTTPGVTIYYTTDGSDPDETDTEATGTVTVDQSMTLKARAFKTGMGPSQIKTEEYTIIPNLNLTLYLEGPYSGSSEMTTVLYENTLIPLESPYTEDSRTVSTIPESSVDWILVELRSEASGAAIFSRSAFLLNNGMTADEDGYLGIRLAGVDDGDYYIVVKHQNHLAIMSALAQTVQSGDTLNYDFSTADTQFYGTDGYKELETNVWGQWAGDADQDGTVGSADYTAWYNSAIAGDAGYEAADCNLDGEVTTADYTLWYNNYVQRAASGVP